MTSASLNSTILEPLFAPWAEPNAHRVRVEKPGDPAAIVQGRRASPIDYSSCAMTPTPPTKLPSASTLREATRNHLQTAGTPCHSCPPDSDLF